MQEELESRQRANSTETMDSFKQMNSINPKARVFLKSENEEIKPRANSNRSNKSNDSYSREVRQQTESIFHTIPLKEVQKKKKSPKINDPIDRSHTLKELQDNWNDSVEQGSLDKEFQKVNGSLNNENACLLIWLNQLNRIHPVPSNTYVIRYFRFEITTFYQEKL